MEPIKAYFIGGELDLSVKMIDRNLNRYMHPVHEYPVGVSLRNGDTFAAKMQVQEYRITRTIETASHLRDIHIFEWVGLD